MTQNSLSARLTAWIILSLLAISIMRITFDSVQERQSTLGELERGAKSLADVVSHQILRTYTLEQTRELQGFMNDLTAKHGGLLLGEILDGGGVVLASSELDRVDTNALMPADMQALRRSGGLVLGAIAAGPVGIDVFRTLAPDGEARFERGILHLQLSTAAVEEASRSRTWRGIGITLVEMVMLGGLLLLLLRRQVVGPLGRMAHHVTEVGKGNLVPFTAGSVRRDEVGTLSEGLQTMTARLLDMIEQLRADGGAVSNAADNLVRTSSQLGTASTEQATALTEVSATVREVAQAAGETSNLAGRVVAQAEESDKNSRAGLSAVEQTGQAMQRVDEQMHMISSHIGELAERMQQIGDLIAAVTALTERSHLLALNASIEAAKAGETGRGFAVVAAEMRALAEGSKRSTEQVRDTIAEVQRAMRVAIETTREGSERTKAAFAQSRQAGDEIGTLAEVISSSAQLARQIAAATQQQSLGVSQASAALDQSRTATDQTVANARHLQSASEELRRIAHGMFTLVGDLAGDGGKGGRSAA